MQRSGLDPPTTVPVRPRLFELILNVAIRSYRAAPSTSTNFLLTFEKKLVDPAGQRVSYCAGSSLPRADTYLRGGLHPVSANARHRESLRPNRCGTGRLDLPASARAAIAASEPHRSMGHRHLTIAGFSAPIAAIDGAAALPAIAKVIESIDLDLGMLICCDRKTRGPVGINHCNRSRLGRR